MELFYIITGVWAGSLLADFTVAGIVIVRAKRRQSKQLARLAAFEAQINAPAENS
jgi:hypothetical protein